METSANRSGIKSPAILYQWIVGIVWAILLVGLPLTSFPPLGNLTHSVVVPFSAIPLFLILVIWFVPHLLRKGAIPGESRPFIAFLLVVIVASAAAFFINMNTIKGKTVFSQEARAFITLSIGVAFYFTMSAWPTSQPRLRRAIQWINIGGVILILWALVQSYYIVFHGVNYPGWFANLRDHLVVQNSAVRDDPRVTGMAYEPSWFAHLLNVLYFPLWLSATFQGTSVFRFRIWKLSFENMILVPGLVVFYLSSPRVGMIAFLLMLVFLIVKVNIIIYRKVLALITRYLPASQARLKLIKAATQVGLALIFMALYVGGIYVFVQVISQHDWRYKLLATFTSQDVQDLKFNEASIMYIGARLAFLERLTYWFTGWHIFNDYPWLGVGLGNAGFYFPNRVPYMAWDSFEIRDVFFRLYDLPNVKSMWVRILAETGMFGFVCFSTWYLTLWRSARLAWRSMSPTIRLVSLAGQLALIAFLVEGFSIDSFALPYLWIIAGLIAAAGALYRASPNPS